jgi:hypothetical protein
MFYATLAQTRGELDAQRLGTGEPSGTINDRLVIEALRAVTGRISEKLAPKEFLPYKETRYFDAAGWHIDAESGMLQLKNAKGTHPLLAVTSVVDGNGTTLVLGTDYRLYPRDATPAFHLHMLASSGKSWQSYSTDWVEAIAVTGTFGYRTRYAQAWQLSGATVRDNPLTISATSILVEDTDVVNPQGRLPRFSAGNLIQIESEWCEVVSVNDGTNTLTVTRGARGTTAASHVQGTPISVFDVEPAMNRAAYRWAAYLYKRIGAFDQTRYDGLATVEFPADMPGEVRDVLEMYEDKGWDTP